MCHMIVEMVNVSNKPSSHDNGLVARLVILTPTNSILVVSAYNVARAERFFRGRGLTFITGSRFNGDYVGDSDHQAQGMR